MEDAVIRQKLVTDEKLLRRISKRLVNAGANGVAPEELEQFGMTLQAELGLLEYTLNKQQRSIQVHESEEQYYAEKQTRLENLEQILETEQQSRRNKDEYDAIAREILKYTPRADLARAIEEVEGEVEQIVEEQGEIHQYIEREAIAGYVAIQNVKTVRRTVDGDLKALQK